MWLVLIERSSWGLSSTIKTVEIVEELIEIWPNEVCDTLDQKNLFRVAQRTIKRVSSRVRMAGRHCMRNLGGSWINIMSDTFFCVSRMVSVRILFFLMFCKKVVLIHKFLPPIARQVELALISWVSWTFLMCHSQLKWYFQNGHLVLLAICSPLQLIHLKVCGCGSSGLVSNLEGLIFGLALQYHAIFLWCSSLWGPLHFWHLDPWDNGLPSSSV